MVGCLQGLIASEELRQSIHGVRVIDSNQLLPRCAGGGDRAAVWGDQLETVYQQNLRGSGGFSRGITETVRAVRRPMFCCSTTTWWWVPEVFGGLSRYH